MIRRKEREIRRRRIKEIERGRRRIRIIRR